MGEARRKAEKLRKSLIGPLTIETPKGKVQVRWNQNAAATPLGQMAFFIEFLHLSGLWSNFVDQCPLLKEGWSRARVESVLGTWVLSCLAGHRRYAHVTALRCDGVNPDLLGLSGLVSEDTLRRGLAHIPKVQGEAWLDQEMGRVAVPLLTRRWVLDADTTIKPLYGHQEGAMVGYNPQKPGRPSHAYHSYLVGSLRLVLGVEVEAGNHSNANYAVPGLLRLLDQLPADQRPELVRGDKAFGVESIMSKLEERGQAYLFKLRLTQTVKRQIKRQFSNPNWVKVGQGWEAIGDTLQLAGWSRSRRVAILRRPLQGDVVLADQTEQLSFAFIEPHTPVRSYEYGVLVTSLDYDLSSLAQLYRDRGDAENTFDELKNQWGWGGYTTHDLHRCQLSARAVALVYNWWSVFVRLGSPDRRREAITSRPFLLSGLALRSEHAGQTQITITSVHAHRDTATTTLARISAALQAIRDYAEQFRTASVWQAICELLAGRITQQSPISGLFLHEFSSG